MKISCVDLYRGRVKRENDALAVLTADEDHQKTIEAWIGKGKYHKLIDLWVNGLVVDWDKLYAAPRPKRISLPTYPFAKARYWIFPAKERHTHNNLGDKQIIPTADAESSKLMLFEEVRSHHDD